MDFVALDFETSNSKRTSICQVGLATFKAGKLVEQWTELINPSDYFDPINISIHGIDEKAVKHSPTFPKIYPEIDKRTKSLVVVSHSSFDFVALEQTIKFHNLPILERDWLDTIRVARRAWQELSNQGYGLKNLANEFGINFEHHDAGEDARVCGELLVKAIQDTGLTLTAWLERVQKPISLDSTKTYRGKIDGNPEGHLFGETAVFTGKLSLSRREAKEIAAKAGCNISSTVNNNTTILVLGDQDISRLAGHTKSTKHRKAEELISQGHHVKIIGETDFIALTKLY